MAFLAVLREGLETAVFMLAAFQQSDRPGLTGTGALLGVAVAVVLGYLIYRGGVKINLSKFFRITGVVLVLVGAGLLAFAVHTAHEARLVATSCSTAPSTSRWLIDPGSVQSALITGMFGIQPEPTWGELLAFLAYAIPMTIYVCRPTAPTGARRGRSLPRSRRPSKPSDRPNPGRDPQHVPNHWSRRGRADASSGAVLDGRPRRTRGAKTAEVKVEINDDGCPAKLTIKAGPTNFKVTNSGSGDVSEFEILSGDRILGEVENVAPGLNKEFSLTLKAGNYTTVLPGRLGATRASSS